MGHMGLTVQPYKFWKWRGGGHKCWKGGVKQSFYTIKITYFCLMIWQGGTCTVAPLPPNYGPTIAWPVQGFTCLNLAGWVYVGGGQSILIYYLINHMIDHKFVPNPYCRKQIWEGVFYLFQLFETFYDRLLTPKIIVFHANLPLCKFNLYEA